MNVALFRNRASAEVISCIEVMWVRMSPRCNMTGVIIRRGEDKKTDTQREGQVATDSEIGVMSLHAKEGQQLLTTLRSQKEEKKDSSLEPSERTWTCQHLISDFWPAELYKK